MFTNRDIEKLDTAYFNVLYSSPFAVTLQSKNTGHQWHLIVTANKVCLSCEVYHRHKASDPWHRQWGSKKYPDVLDAIRDHDQYQLDKNSRKASLNP